MAEHELVLLIQRKAMHYSWLNCLAYLYMIMDIICHKKKPKLQRWQLFLFFVEMFHKKHLYMGAGTVQQENEANGLLPLNGIYQLKYNPLSNFWHTTWIQF